MKKDNLNELVTSYEQKPAIRNIQVFKDSGLIVYASDSPKLGALFIPSLGPTPKFCSFLENLTEELEQKTGLNVMEEFKFVTYDELA